MNKKHFIQKIAQKETGFFFYEIGIYLQKFTGNVREVWLPSYYYPVSCKTLYLNIPHSLTCDRKYLLFHLSLFFHDHFFVLIPFFSLFEFQMCFCFNLWFTIWKVCGCSKSRWWWQSLFLIFFEMVVCQIFFCERLSQFCNYCTFN